ncbi:MAG: Fe-S cluster assembly protein SufD, partial [Planctomycetaceae bacterium]
MSASGTATDTAASFGATAFESFLATRDEPDWITAQRRAAFASYQESQAEELDPEEWKRIDLRTFRPDRYELCAEPAADASANLESLLTNRTEFAGQVSHLDGHCVGQSVSDELSKQG